MGKSPLNALAGLTGAAPSLAKVQTGLATAALSSGAATAAMGTFASLPKPSLPKLTAPVMPAALPKLTAPVIPAALPKPVAPVIPVKPVAPILPVKPVASVRPLPPRPLPIKRKGGARKSRSTRKKSRRNARR